MPNPTRSPSWTWAAATAPSANGNPLPGRASLRAGDIVRLGSTDIVVVGRPVATAPVVPPRATVIARPVEGVPVPEPPPPAPVVVGPSPGRQGDDRALGITTRPGQPVFPNYMGIRRRIPIPVWNAIRVVSVCAYIALCVGLFVLPAGGLFWFFKVVVPLLPITFFVDPGSVAQRLSARRLQPGAPRARLYPRLRSAPMVAQLRLHSRRLPFFGITSAELAVFNTGARATGFCSR